MGVCEGDGGIRHGCCDLAEWVGGEGLCWFGGDMKGERCGMRGCLCGCTGVVIRCGGRRGGWGVDGGGVCDGGWGAVAVRSGFM